MDFFCGSAAACAAVTLTNPLEVVRTLFQLRHELQSGPVQPFHLLRYIRSEGILSLQRGLSAALPYQFIMNGVRLSLFDLLKDGTILWTVMAAGVCGGVGAFMASPFNLVKTRLQSRSSTLTDVGNQYNYRSIFHWFINSTEWLGGGREPWRAQWGRQWAVVPNYLPTNFAKDTFPLTRGPQVSLLPWWPSSSWIRLTWWWRECITRGERRCMEIFWIVLERFIARRDGEDFIKDSCQTMFDWDHTPYWHWPFMIILNSFDKVIVCMIIQSVFSLKS